MAKSFWRSRIFIIALVVFMCVSATAAILRYTYQQPITERGLPIVVVAPPSANATSSNANTAETTSTSSQSNSASPAQTENASLAEVNAFQDAARQNAELQNTLTWTFGGKQQRGWYLYVPLIQQLIGTESGAGEAEFATALSRWQKSVGLQANGVLDNTTLAVMITTWQSRRLKERGYPSPEQLVLINTPDLYDPARPEELRKARTEAYDAYRRMLAAAIADKSLGLKSASSTELASSEKYLKIVSAFRSREYQERLRQQSPNAGSAGLAVNSPHFTGRALDVYVGGEPVSTEDSNRAVQVQTKIYRWLVRNAERFGFRPYFYEPWHWEYVG